jgi:hypothetical protein
MYIFNSSAIAELFFYTICTVMTPNIIIEIPSSQALRKLIVKFS